ncbi:hypothetical protein Hanom_Chr11g01021871 [Helianthus anomalus]
MTRHIWGPWFSKLSAWDGQSMPFKKVAWLRLIGFPLHLLESDVVKSVGELFGKVMHVQRALGEDKDLSITRVGVLSGVVERINEAVSVKWKNRCYRIWVEEEVDVWVPDFLGGVEGFNPNGSSPLASSPVVKVAESGNGGGMFEEEEEAGMGGGSSRGDDQVGEFFEVGGGGMASKEVCFNWQPFLESCNGDGSKNHGDGTKDILFFKAGKRSKRRRKGGAKFCPKSSRDSPIFLVDSSDKGRPTKRTRAHLNEDSDPFLTRAHLSEDSDPFSLDQLLGLSDKKTDKGNVLPSTDPGVNLNIPLDSDGVPVESFSRPPVEVPS